MDNKTECSVSGCDRQIDARGLCAAHYARLRRHGSALGGGTPTGEPLRWLLAHLDGAGADCIIWPFARTSRGEARIWLNGRLQQAARVSCQSRHGAPPDDKTDAAHSCGRGNDGCVNPNHLRWATRIENMADRVEHQTANRGERHGNAKLSEDSVRSIRSKRSVMSARATAVQFGISPAAVSRIWTGKAWGWLP